MKVIYSDQPAEIEPFRHSIFLAGPTPRSLSVESWRPKALEILKQLDYQGQVFVPEPSKVQENFDYIKQVEWENFGTENCKKVVFWIPRYLPDMPAFTTNVEFGRYVSSGRCLYGRPDDSEKNRYLDWLYNKLHPKHVIHKKLEDLLLKASHDPYRQLRERVDEYKGMSFDEIRVKNLMDAVNARIEGQKTKN